MPHTVSFFKKQHHNNTIPSGILFDSVTECLLMWIYRSNSTYQCDGLLFLVAQKISYWITEFCLNLISPICYIPYFKILKEQKCCCILHTLFLYKHICVWTNKIYCLKCADFSVVFLEHETVTIHRMLQKLKDGIEGTE